MSGRRQATVAAAGTETLPARRVHHFEGISQTGSSDKTARSWRPGDMCHLLSRPKCLGTIVGVPDDETVLVLWSVVPHLNEIEKVADQMACQIRDEIDADILFDLHAAGMVSKKTVLEKFGLDEPPTDL